MRLRGAVLALLLAAPLTAQPALDPSLQQITADRLRADMRFLSHDLLEGRRTGTRGYDLAAEWTASQMEAAGLQPGAPDGSYLQPVPLVRGRARVEDSRLSFQSPSGRRTLEPGRDFVMAPGFTEARVVTEAPLLFAGHGITTADHDDYRKLDARGRVVVLLWGAPTSLPSSLRAHHGSLNVKEANAAAHGAIGVLYLVMGPDDRSWEGVVRRARSGHVRWVGPTGVVSDVTPGLQLIGTLSYAAGQWLLETSSRRVGDVRSGADRFVKGFALIGSVHAESVSEVERSQSPNVVGVLPGSDPRLASEAVVISAHLDHLGLDDAPQGDVVHNGAIDNASGVAGLLATARAFGAAPRRPRRSVVFLAVTGEEQGLIGSGYFAAHPSPAALRPVANVNVDMLTLQYPVQDLVAFGAEHSSLASVVERAASRLGLTVSPDPMPDQRIFVRSDQYSFVRRGVPALMLMGGFRGDRSVDRAEALKKWLSTRYHAVDDDMEQPMHMDSGVLLTRATFLIAADVADANEAPRWNADSPFDIKPGASPRTPTTNRR